MGDLEQVWTAAVPVLDDGVEWVVIGVDLDSGDPGERVVGALLDRGHEGEEGVFYLLPFDLGVRYERAGDRWGVHLVTSPEVLDAVVPEYGEELTAAVGSVRAESLVDGGVVLLRREIGLAEEPVDRPVVLLAREGLGAGADLFAVFDEGQAALAVIGPWSHGGSG